MTDGALAILLATFFTFGFAAIQTLRQRAKAMTPPLTIAVICLGMFVGLLALTEKPEADAPRKSKPTAALRR